MCRLLSVLNLAHATASAPPLPFSQQSPCSQRFPISSSIQHCSAGSRHGSGRAKHTVLAAQPESQAHSSSKPQHEGATHETNHHHHHHHYHSHHGAEEELRVYACSDLHADHAENLQWLKEHLKPGVFGPRSVVIVAGDVSDDLRVLRCGMRSRSVRCWPAFGGGSGNTRSSFTAPCGNAFVTATGPEDGLPHAMMTRQS